MSKRVRPWDKKGSGARRKGPSPVPSQSSSRRRNAPEPFVDVPSVTIDGIPYYSDRFYFIKTLKRKKGGDHVPSAPPQPRATSSSSCTCGAEPQALLDRSRLVESLDLQAAILATFGLETDYMVQQFPSLCGPQATVPTLILHGDKNYVDQQQEPQSTTNAEDDEDKEEWSLRLSIRTEKEKHAEHSIPDGNGTSRISRNATGMTTDMNKSRPSCQDENHPNAKSLDNSFEEVDDDDLSLATQDGPTRTHATDYNRMLGSPSAGVVSEQPPISRVDRSSPMAQVETTAVGFASYNDNLGCSTSSGSGLPRTPIQQQQQQYRNTKKRVRSGLLSPHVSCSRVKSTWIRPQDIPSNQSDWIDSTGHLSKAVLSQREDSLKTGRSRQGTHHPKYMILLERSGSIVVVVSTGNLTWPCSLDAAWIQRFPATKTASLPPCPIPGRPDDFGQHLSRMLQWQMLCLAQKQTTPLHFVREHLGWKDLHDLETAFDYTCAQAHLVVTVPGDHDGCPLYGRQRVSDIVRRLATGTNPWHAALAETNDRNGEDRLIVQPTSLGAQWTTRGLGHLVQSYLPHSSVTDPLKRLDVVWPTAQWMADLRNGGAITTRASSPDSVAIALDPNGGITTHKQSDTIDSHCTSATADTVEGTLFLSSEAFNSISLDCLTCMTMYEPTEPVQHARLVPHFKSICHVIGKSDDKTDSVERLAWFLLTSACLSKGAQGHWVKDKTVAYANFECGVLFCSRSQGKRATDRLYVARDARPKCRCHEEQKVVHLAIPYKLRSTRYTDNDDDDEFVETPFFHEVQPGSACTGNMTLTPYGRDLVDKLARSGG